MRKWFVAAVNVLLAGIILLLWRLELKKAANGYAIVEARYITRILLSFTILTFLILLWSVTKNKKEP